MDIGTVSGAINDLVSSAAIITGGAWAYFRFIKGRTFAPRAELSVTSSFETGSADSRYLKFSATMKNTGLSKIPLSGSMKAIRLFGALDSEDDGIHTCQWTLISTNDIFDRDELLDGQETIADSVMYRLPQLDHPRYAAYQAEVLVGTAGKRPLRWSARSVPLTSPENGSQQPQPQQLEAAAPTSETDREPHGGYHGLKKVEREKSAGKAPYGPADVAAIEGEKKASGSRNGSRTTQPQPR